MSSPKVPSSGNIRSLWHGEVYYAQKALRWVSRQIWFLNIAWASHKKLQALHTDWTASSDNCMRLDTTRAPRTGEQNGREYHFATKDSFLDLVGQNGFIEYAQFGVTTTAPVYKQSETLRNKAGYASSILRWRYALGDRPKPLWLDFWWLWNHRAWNKSSAPISMLAFSSLRRRRWTSWRRDCANEVQRPKIPWTSA